MKNSFFRRMVFVCLLLMLTMGIYAQTSTAIPVDENVRIGKLENGMTYYIRHNAYPQGQAEFYIAQKVGSILEEDNQRGLAHFLEHMCFNGTKHFPGNNLVKWCESVGVKFGYNLNAYTSIERTVYNISGVPTARESVQDSCLLILHDWACDLLLEDSEIDSERSVIHEEWRSQMSPTQRIMEKLLPKMYPGNRYGYRFPIGVMEVVDNFPYDALRNYYRKWYRPDLQGIMVVGDIDVDRIEAKIKELFSPIEMPQDVAERTIFGVDDNEQPIYAIGTDKEQTRQQAMIMFKHDAVNRADKDNVNYLKESYMSELASMMINNRLSEISSKADAPFARAGCYDGDFFVANTKGAYIASVTAKDDMCKSFEAVYREVLRALRHGFTANEYERMRLEYKSQIERSYRNRNQIESNTLVEEYVEHFLDNEPIPSVEQFYTIMNKIASAVTVDDVNAKLKSLVNPERNVVVLAMMPEKPDVKVPTEEQLDAIVKAVNAEDIAAYVDNVKNDPLIAKLPVKGKVKQESYNADIDAKEWILSNGVKVIVKKTDFKEDEVLMNVVAKNGLAMFPESDAINLKVIDMALRDYSLGTYNSQDLNNYLLGKQVSLRFSQSDYTRSLNARTTPRDLKTLMELTYASFTALSIDAEEYAAMVSANSAILRQQEGNPRTVFQKRRLEALYSQPRNQMLTADELEHANRDRILEMAKRLYSNAADFVFTFVGNFNEVELRQLVEQYIATLPANKDNVTTSVQLAGLGINRCSYVKEYNAKMEVPQVYASISYIGDAEFTTKNMTIATIAGQVMSTRLIEKVREQEGATYSISASCSMSPLRDDMVVFRTVFPMKPEKKEVVFDIIKREFADMAANVTDAEVQKVREFLLKQYLDQLKKNDAWMSAINGYCLMGINTMNGYDEIVNSITHADVEQFVAKLIEQNNFNVVFLNPDEKK
ncbi:MAG: M16 family metallopeptidase [Muribaculaceae bacterium]